MDTHVAACAEPPNIQGLVVVVVVYPTAQRHFCLRESHDSTWSSLYLSKRVPHRQTGIPACPQRWIVFSDTPRCSESSRLERNAP